MNRFKHFLYLLLVFAPTLVSAQVKFVDLDFAEALEQAKKEHKLVFVDFRADWCKPCVEMEQTTFQDSSLGTFMAPHFIAIKFDVDKFSGPDLRNRYSVNSYPTILVIDPQTELVEIRMIGYKPARILRGDLQMVLDFRTEDGEK